MHSRATSTHTRATGTTLHAQKRRRAIQKVHHKENKKTTLQTSKAVILPIAPAKNSVQVILPSESASILCMNPSSTSSGMTASTITRHTQSLQATQQKERNFQEQKKTISRQTTSLQVRENGSNLIPGDTAILVGVIIQKDVSDAGSLHELFGEGKKQQGRGH